ncbi:MAG: hypothetical protein AMK75_03890 [Planctomycetes bacterium SM23_65]|nr:MAG: hypothetical protein AMK75_03890 [Planctomycetes bacterium SM23_65]
MSGKRLFVVLVAVGFAGTSFAVNPVVVGDRFDAFCATHFGAPKEPEMYKGLGSEITVPRDGIWTYASRNSAVIAWESSLPARTYVQYGMRANAYIYVTPITTYNHFIHVHYLQNLEPNTTYHYRLVTMDERVLIVRTDDMTFSTPALTNAVVLPGSLPGPPYTLDKPNTTYLVPKDIQADSTAFNITADGVTLDLGGKTVTYNEKAGAPDGGASERLYGWHATRGPCGIRTADGKKGIRIVNGTLTQGKANSTSRPAGYYPVYLRRPRDAEAAGLNVIYAGAQVSGVLVSDAYDGCSVHHNVIHDKGTELYNRHRGVEAILFSMGTTTKTSKCHHNLIKRTRHVGIKASPKNEIFSNEIRIDSYATNSYGVGYYSQKGASDISIHHNRIFGTGFHPIGIGSGQGYSNVRVYENYVEMRGTHQEWRWQGGEGGGDADAKNRTGVYPVNGIRLQSPKTNVAHYNNTVVVKGSGKGCVMRGLWLVPDNRIGSNVNFRGNRVKLLALDVLARGYAIAACGAGPQTAKPAITLEGNVVESNLVNVQLGDNYGSGGPYLFVGNTLRTVGPLPGYRTVRIGWQGNETETYGHRFEDTKFEGGASFDSVSFDGAGGRTYNFSVAWTLDIRTAPGANVSIKNESGRTIYTGTADNTGKRLVSLTEYVSSPSGKSMRTPHTIIVSKGGRSAEKKITLNAPQTVEISP